MKNRNPIVVAILCCIPCTFYALIWLVKTKREMVSQGADIPTSWLLIIPIVNLFWGWKWAQGVEKVTNGAWGAVPAFLLCFLFIPVGAFLTQTQFNKLALPAPAA